MQSPTKTRFRDGIISYNDSDVFKIFKVIKTCLQFIQIKNIIFPQGRCVKETKDGNLVALGLAMVDKTTALRNEKLEKEYVIISRNILNKHFLCNKLGIILWWEAHILSYGTCK